MLLENFTSVFDLLGSESPKQVLGRNRPNDRYYGGNEYIDQVELLCEKRALEAFKSRS